MEGDGHQQRSSHHGFGSPTRHPHNAHTSSRGPGGTFSSLQHHRSDENAGSAAAASASARASVEDFPAVSQDPLLSFGEEDAWRSPGSAPELRYSRNKGDRIVGGMKSEDILLHRRTEQSARANVATSSISLEGNGAPDVGINGRQNGPTTQVHQGESSSHFRQFASPSPIRSHHSAMRPSNFARTANKLNKTSSLTRSRTPHTGPNTSNLENTRGEQARPFSNSIRMGEHNQRSTNSLGLSVGAFGGANISAQQRLPASRQSETSASRNSASRSSTHYSQEQNSEDVFGDSCTLSQPSIHQWYSMSPRTPSATKETYSPPSSSESNQSSLFSRESTSNNSRKSGFNVHNGPPKTASDDPSMFQRRELSRESSNTDIVDPAAPNFRTSAASREGHQTTDSLPHSSTNGTFLSNPGRASSPTGALQGSDRHSESDQHLRTRSRSAKVRRDGSKMEKSSKVGQTRKAASARPRRSWLTFSHRPPTRQRNILPNSIDDLNTLTESFQNTTSTRAQAIWKELASYREEVSSRARGESHSQNGSDGRRQNGKASYSTTGIRSMNSMNTGFDIPVAIREEESGDENSDSDQKTSRRSSSQTHRYENTGTIPPNRSHHFETYDSPAERDGFVNMPVTYDVPINVSYTRRSRIQSAAARANIKSKPNLEGKASAQKKPVETTTSTKPNRGTSARQYGAAKLRQTSSARPRQQMLSRDNTKTSSSSETTSRVSLNNLSISEAYAAGVESASALTRGPNGAVRDEDADPRPSTEEKPGETNGKARQSSSEESHKVKEAEKTTEQSEGDTLTSPRNASRRDVLKQVQDEMLEWERQMMIKRGSASDGREGENDVDVQDRIDFDDIFIESSDGEESSGEWSTENEEGDDEAEEGQEEDDESLANQIGKRFLCETLNSIIAVTVE
eukprot:gb/GECG01005148.1/.p1 GENE.gb/GECG01005148.1/~~gb/GECG01005148.1/.p1  ORF type:complete len:912 (+),score=121.22 gb/GECG01005148.1/:1-2736(+)